MTAKTATTTSRIRKLKRKDKKKVIKSAKKLPGSFVLLGRTFQHIWRGKKLYAGIMLIFALGYVLLVKGLAFNFQVAETRDAINETLGNEIGTAEKATTLLGVLMGTSGTASGEAASVYQTFLFIMISLVIIWSLRQTFDGKTGPKITVKNAFYKSMTPLIPYVLVCMVIMLQALPALIGIGMYGTVTTSGLAVGAVEQILWFVGFILLLAVSIYLLSSSLFASYIVTLPDMKPLQALRSARKLVKFRRLVIIRKVLFLPLFILVSFAVIFLPMVLLLPIVAEILFFIMSILLILVMHTYFYLLYRELL